MAEVAIIEEHDDEHYTLRTPYNADFVAELKAMIPSHDRKWNPDERTWLIKTSVDLLDIVTLAKQHFSEVECDL